LRRPPTPTLFPYTTLFRSQLVVVDAALHADRPTLGLGDPQAAVADDEHALGDVLDVAPERVEPLALGERPVRDGAHLEQHRAARSEEHTSELQSRRDLVCR